MAHSTSYHCHPITTHLFPHVKVLLTSRPKTETHPQQQTHPIYSFLPAFISYLIYSACYTTQIKLNCEKQGLVLFVISCPSLKFFQNRSCQPCLAARVRENCQYVFLFQTHFQFYLFSGRSTETTWIAPLQDNQQKPWKTICVTFSFSALMVTFPP